MKKYYVNIFLIFVLVLTVALLFSSLIYSQTTNKLREKHATETITDINQQVSLAIDLRLKNDYDRFVRFVEENETLDALNTNKDRLVLSDVNVTGFVEINNNEFITPDMTFYFKEGFKQAAYHQQNIMVYRLSDALDGVEDSTEYCFFKHGDIVGYFSATLYFEPLFLLGKDPDNFYLLVTPSGYIGYRKDETVVGSRLLIDVLPHESAPVKSLLANQLAAKRSGHIRVKLLEKPSYLAYRSLENAEIMVLQSFPQASLYATVAFVSVPVFYMLGVMIICFLIFIVFVYFYLNKKNNDIEFSKRRYYYNKPYMLKISKKGAIKSFNQTCYENFKDVKQFQTVYDFAPVKESIDVMDDIKKQAPFTVAFESKQNSLEYLRFMPIKTGGGYYLLGENITLQQKDLEYHRNMALYNPATQLPNKNYLGIKLQNLFSGPDFLDLKNALVAIDITSFKNINRLFGQKISQATLVKAASIIQNTLGSYNAILYNVETEVFMVLFLGLNKYQEAIDWSDRLSSLFEKPIDVSGNLFNIEVKIGVFEIDTNRYSNVNPLTSYDNALLALKRAKESRRTNVVAYDIGMGQVFTRTQAMEVDLVSALKNKEFKIFYQPQLNTMNNQIIAFESLLRWDNPKYALDSPALFIELAEQNNMIMEIGRFIINETFQVAKEFEKYNVRISINVSPIQVLQSGFVYDMTSAFDRFKLKKNSIVIEITETMLMESFDSIIDKLIILKKHGFMIHLDNFGTGYSSMLYLKDLPIDGISISRDFVKNLENDRHARTIVSKIISLANSLEIEIIAEGVETEKQKAFLNQNGCFIIQGFLFSKAVDKASAIKMLDQYNIKSKTKIDNIDYYDFLR